MDKQYYLLEGGPGTGKTFVTAALISDLAQAGYKVVCLFPTHKSKNVAADELKKSNPSARTVRKTISGGRGKRQRENEVRIDINGYEVSFRSMHSFLSLSPTDMYNHKAERMKSATTQNTKTLAVNHTEMKMETLQRRTRPTIYFVDEVSMITDWMIDLDPENPGDDLEKMYKDFRFELRDMLSMGLINVLENAEDTNYIMHFSGDFDQLKPAGFEDSNCYELLHQEAVEATKLLVNHRAKDAQDIVELLEQMKNTGKLPDDPETENVAYFRDRGKFTSEFLREYENNTDVCYISYENNARKTMESTVSSKINDEDSIIYNGSKVMSAETKYEFLDGSDNVSKLVIFSGEIAEINYINSRKERVEGTEWARDFFNVKLVNGAIIRPNENSARYYLHVHGHKNEYKAYLEYVNNIFIPELRRYARENLNFEKKTDRYLGPEISYDKFSKKMRDSSISKEFKAWENWEYLGGRKVYDLFARYWDGWEFKSRGWADPAEGIYKYTFKNAYAKVSESILPVKSTFAMTCHTAQGSGFDKIFVDHRDFNTRDMDTYKRLLYVGVSRAKKKLNILI